METTLSTNMIAPEAADDSDAICAFVSPNGGYGVRLEEFVTAIPSENLGELIAAHLGEVDRIARVRRRRGPYRDCWETRWHEGLIWALRTEANRRDQAAKAAK